jgi:hypothetical protein
MQHSITLNLSAKVYHNNRHYDLRIEAEDETWSWKVSMNPVWKAR